MSFTGKIIDTCDPVGGLEFLNRINDFYNGVLTWKLN